MKPAIDKENKVRTAVYIAAGAADTVERRTRATPLVKSAGQACSTIVARQGLLDLIGHGPRRSNGTL